VRSEERRAEWQARDKVRANRYWCTTGRDEARARRLTAVQVARACAQLASTQVENKANRALLWNTVGGKTPYPNIPPAN